MSATPSLLRKSLSGPAHPVGPSPAHRPPSRQNREPNLRQKRIRRIWMNATAWTFQGWLAMFFAGAALAKLTAPYDQLVLLLGWPSLVPLSSVRVMGFVELALASTMLAPLVIGKVAGMRIVRAGAMFLIGLQAAALLVHAVRLEPGLAFINLILLALTTAVLVLRRHSV